jgi:hypothetical protein
MGHRVSNLAVKAVYGVITPETVEAICNRRLLAADLLSRVDDDRTAHAAKMVRETVLGIREELMGLIS